MKSMLVTFLFALISLSAVQASADDSVATVRWTENNQTISINAEDVKKSTTPLFGYVLDLTTKKDICYTGTDMGAMGLIYSGLNHHGTEICDSYFIVAADGTLYLGPCQQPSVREDFYSATIPLCPK